MGHIRLLILRESRNAHHDVVSIYRNHILGLSTNVSFVSSRVPSVSSPPSKSGNANAATNERLFRGGRQT
jgi:hypothetical protein